MTKLSGMGIGSHLRAYQKFIDIAEGVVVENAFSNLDKEVMG